MSSRGSIAPTLLFQLLLVGCSKQTPPRPADAATAVASAPAPPPAASSATAAVVAPPGDFGMPGPIRVKGYSRVTSTGMNDPAYAAGFSADGEHIGYCSELGARSEPQTRCLLLSRDGSKLTLSSDVNDAFDPAAKRRLDAWVEEHGIPIQVPARMETPTARELVGTWAFARDLTLVLDEHAQGKTGAAVRVGGSVGTEAPVFPVFVDHPLPGSPHHRSWVEAFALSPDSKELGLVAGFFCMEWCDDFEVRRWPVVRLAAQIYNDTAMRHHAARDYAGSAALFLKATQADPTFPLATYNLACAYARLRDPSTQRMLEAAIALDPSARARALKDADFDAVRSEPWFPR